MTAPSELIELKEAGEKWQVSINTTGLDVDDDGNLVLADGDTIAGALQSAVNGLKVMALELQKLTRHERAKQPHIFTGYPGLQ